MTNEERYRKYIETQCCNCKNRKKDLCEIRISVVEGIVYTKCAYYEKDKEMKKPKKILFRTARQNKPLMKLNI